VKSAGADFDKGSLVGAVGDRQLYVHAIGEDLDLLLAVDPEVEAKERLGAGREDCGEIR
jgi:hypothetical protein